MRHGRAVQDSDVIPPDGRDAADRRSEDGCRDHVRRRAGDGVHAARGSRDGTARERRPQGTRRTSDAAEVLTASRPTELEEPAPRDVHRAISARALVVPIPEGAGRWTALLIIGAVDGSATSAIPPDLGLESATEARIYPQESAPVTSGAGSVVIPVTRPPGGAG